MRASAVGVRRSRELRRNAVVPLSRCPVVPVGGMGGWRGRANNPFMQPVRAAGFRIIFRYIRSNPFI